MKIAHCTERIPATIEQEELQQARNDIRHCARVIASLNSLYRGAMLLPTGAIDFAETKAAAEIRLIGKF